MLSVCKEQYLIN